MAGDTAITVKDLTPKQLISFFSNTSLVELHKLIRVPGLPPLVPINRPACSSLGSLDQLPLECLLEIMELLDYQSLSRLSQTSLAIKGLVESFQPYFQMRTHASPTLEALGRARLLSVNSAYTLYSVLVSEDCAGCGRFGPCLFLPTCERCCLHCVYENKSFKVTSFASARCLFGLSDPQNESLTVMHSIPGSSLDSYARSRYEETKLVPISQLKGLVPRVRRRKDSDSVPGLLYLTRLTAHVENETYRYLDSPYDGVVETRFESKDPFLGMGSVLFPSITGRSISEKGLWCYGCDWILWKKVFQSDILHPTESTLKNWEKLHAAVRLARKRADFLEHVKQCPGVKGYLRDNEETDPGMDVGVPISWV